MKRREHKRWTEVEEELLEHMHMQHASIKDIAKQLDRTEYSINNHKTKMGLGRHLYDDDWHIQLRATRRERKTHT